MKRWFAAVAALALSACATPDMTRVRVAQGDLIGAARGETALFVGVPYAQPPVGDLRWRAPLAPETWDGERDATQHAAACAQNSYGWNEADAARSSEDCLYLEVRTPARSSRERLPVLVWFHGGSNRAGSGNWKVLSAFADRGVVMVGVNYRLGPFGFLSHAELSAEAGASGNYGLMDQIAALRWVQENIARFGGDARNVTIGGDSAGAQDVTLLMVSPLSRGLFQRAIAQSGTAQFGWPPRTLAQNEAIGVDAQRRLGAASLAQMRAASTGDVLAIEADLRSASILDQSYLWLQPVVDGAVILEAPRKTFARGATQDIDLLIGSNGRELDFPGGRDALGAYLALAFGANADAARSYYGLDDQPSRDAKLLTIANDAMFRCPAIETAAAQARAGRRTFHYHYTREQAGHGAELSVVMNNTSVSADGVTLQDYWLNFIRSGDPNGGALPRWPAYEVSTRTTMEFADSGPTLVNDLSGGACRLLAPP